MRRRALGLLARREHSIAELRSKLRSRHMPEGEDVDTVVDALAAAGLVNDQRFAESFIRSRRERGQGPLRIEAELRQRGIDADRIADLLDVRDGEWFSLARDVRRKRFGAGSPSEFSERARQARFLRARGFTEDQVRSALRDDGLS